MDHKQILKVFAVLLLCLAIIGSATAQVPDFPERMPIVQPNVLRGSGQIQFRNYW